jgi:hypothetical protein
VDWQGLLAARGRLAHRRARRTRRALAGPLLVATACAALLAATPLTAAASGSGTWADTTVSPPSSPTHLSGIVWTISCPAAGSCVAAGYLASAANEDIAVVAGDSSGTWTSTEPPIPSPVYTQPDELIYAVSCGSATSCVAVGQYKDSSSDQQGLLLSDSSGTWSAAKAPLPANALTSNQGVILRAVSCVSAGNCAAAGSYFISGANGQVLLTESSGTWSAAQAPLGPSGTANSDSVTAISCPSANNCAAVGTYTDSAGTEGLLLTESSGTWSAAKAPLPASAPSSGRSVTISSIFCDAVGNCAAVGTYKDTTGQTQGLLLTDSSGTWASGTEAPLPANAASSGQAVSLTSVSCPVVLQCVAGGYFLDSNGVHDALLLSQSFLSWSATEASLPSGALTTSTSEIEQISCPSAGNCGAVGLYADASGTEFALEAESSGSWTPTEFSPPSTMSPSPVGHVDAASCPSATTCLAVGSYTDSSSHTQGLILSETAGTWSSSTAPLSSSTAANPSVSLAALSCASATSCVAVGDYRDGSNYLQGLVETDSSGTWTASEAPVPSGAATNPYLELTAVSCSSSTSCTAIDAYEDSSSHWQADLLTDNGGTWSASEVTMPTNAQQLNPISLACSSSSSCVAGASYVDTSYNGQVMLLTDSSGSGTAISAPTPSGAATHPFFTNSLDSVACASSTSCIGVGTYEDSSGNAWALIETDTSGSWSAAKAAVPSGAATNPSAALAALTCPSATSCLAVGTYNNSSSDTESQVLTDTSGSWAAATLPIPSGAGTNPDATPTAVACFAVGNCIAFGTYDDSSGNTQGMVLVGAGGTWSASEAVLPANALSDPGIDATAATCSAIGTCLAAGYYIDSGGGADALLETYTETAPLALAPASLSIPVTLNGYNQAVPGAFTIDVSALGYGGWDLTVQASGVPTSGTSTLADPVLNGSSTAAASSTAPVESCVGSCTLASGDAVVYPLGVPSSAPADLYNAAVASGVGEVALATDLWVALPANLTLPGSAYTMTLTLTVSSGP